MRNLLLALIGLLLVVSTPSTAAPRSSSVNSAGLDLKRTYPGVQIKRSGMADLRIYGRGMSRGATPDLAVTDWLDRYGDLLAVPVDQIHELSRDLVGEKFTLFRFNQTLDGLPVEGAQIRVLVRNGTRSEVVYVGARSLATPPSSFLVDQISAKEAVLIVKALEGYENLTTWTEPGMVALPGRNGAPAARTWKFSGSRIDGPRPEAYTFFVGAADGTLMEVRSRIFANTVSGTVRGNATRALLPDTSTNPPVVMEIPDFPVSASNCTGGIPLPGGRGFSCHVFTESQGGYFLGFLNGPQLVSYGGYDGEVAIVFSVSSPAIIASAFITPPATYNPFLNSTPTEFDTAQLNAKIHTTLAHDFYKTRQPTFTGIDIPILTLVNTDSPCFAFFTPNTDLYGGLSINLPREGTSFSGDSCPNWAYSTIIVHEYGHFLHYQLGVTIPGAFAEGFSDSLTNLVFDDSVLGQDAFGPGTGQARDSATPDILHPCQGATHDCGLLLAGVWWDIKLQFEAAQGTSVGLEATRQLFTHWARITSGPDNGQAAGPNTAIEVLTVDDNDETLCNETPNWTEICAAFASHNIDCPDPCP